MLTTANAVEQEIHLEEYEKSGIRVFVKREDLIHPYISGNKWRKLKYNLLNYRQGDFRGIVTFGGAYSNHLLALSALCAHENIAFTGLIRGERPATLNTVLSLSMLWGMRAVFLSRGNYNDKEALTLKWEQEGYFVIPEGGENEAGVKGCCEIVQEIRQQYDHIFCACGTGGTLSGILQGIYASDFNPICNGIPVLKNSQSLNQTIKKYSDAAFVLHSNYHFGGYAKVTEELMGFIHRLASKTGILTDPVYTGKLFYAVSDLAGSGYFKRGDVVLIIHSGGLTGWLSETMLENLNLELKNPRL